MTHEQAKKSAEEIVYCDYTMLDIISSCELFGITTRNKNGKLIKRAALEIALIEKMTEIFEKQ